MDEISLTVFIDPKPECFRLKEWPAKRRKSFIDWNNHRQ